MDESTISNYTDNSIISLETEANSMVGTSFENQYPISQNLKNHIITAIVTNLKDIIKENKQQGRNKNIFKDIFYLEQIPPIALETYVRHIVKYSQMNISSLILSVIYIDLFCERFNYVLTLNNIYRLIIIAIYISIKYNEDIFVNTKTYSAIVGITPDDLKNMEFQMCVALDFSFFVNQDYYQQYFIYFSKFSA